MERPLTPSAKLLLAAFLAVYIFALWLIATAPYEPDLSEAVLPVTRAPALIDLVPLESWIDDMPEPEQVCFYTGPCIDA